MQAALDRVIQTYGMIVSLTPAEEHMAREHVAAFLAKAKTDL
jgi:hypothetical protein